MKINVPQISQMHADARRKEDIESTQIRESSWKQKEKIL